MTEHPPIDILARFAQGLLGPREMAAAAIHIAGCGTCRAAATRPSIHPETGPSTYTEAIHQVARRAAHRADQHERETRRAPGALDQILALPTEDWNRAIRSSPRYHSYAFAQHALETCKATWSDNPHRSERLAELALEVANRLPDKEHGRRNLNDLRSKAWAYMANCRRIKTDFLTVPNTLEAAVELHHAGTGAERDRMMLLSFARSLLSETNNYEAAANVLQEIEDLAAHLNDRHSIGRVRWALSRIQLAQRQMDEAVESIRDARRLMLEQREIGTTAKLKLSTTHALAQAGDLGGALGALRTINQTEVQRMGKLDQLRLIWLEGLLYRKRGDLQHALAKLNQCRCGFVRSKIPGDVALLDLEVAQIHLDMRSRQPALTAATHAFPVFALAGMQQKTANALDLFVRAGGLE